MATSEEIEGRFAAMELAIAMALHSAGVSRYASTWNLKATGEATKAIDELRQSLSGSALAAGEQAITRMFDRSRIWQPNS